MSGVPAVRAGLAASLARPGGNITGLSQLSGDYGVKWLELLKEAAPNPHRVAVLWNPDNPYDRQIKSNSCKKRRTRARSRVDGPLGEARGNRSTASLLWTRAARRLLVVTDDPSLIPSASADRAHRRAANAGDLSIPRLGSERRTDVGLGQPLKLWATGRRLCRSHSERGASGRATRPGSLASCTRKSRPRPAEFWSSAKIDFCNNIDPKATSILRRRKALPVCLPPGTV